MSDETKTPRTSEDLLSSERELRHIFDHVPVRIWYKDDQNRIIRLNARAAESMGLSIEEAEGACTYELFPEMAKKYHDDDLAVITSGEPRLGIIEPYTPKHGQYGWCSTDKIPYTDPATGNRYVLVMSHDVTEQIEAEGKLRESKARTEAIIESTFDGFWDWHDNEDYEYMSPQFWRMFGIDPETKRHHPSEWEDIIFKEDHERAIENFKAHLDSKGKIPYSEEIRFRHVDGSTVTVLCRGRVVEWDLNDNPLRVIGTHTDITELKAAQEEAAFASRRFEAAAEEAQVGIWDWNFEDGTTFVSNKFWTMMGVDPESDAAKSERWDNFLIDEDRELARTTFEKHVKSKGREPYFQELRFQHRDGSVVTFLSSGRVIKWSEDGKPLRIIGAITDITEFKAAKARAAEMSRRFQITVDNARIGIWEWRLDRGEKGLWWSRTATEILGYAPGEIPMTLPFISELVHPEDRSSIRQSLWADLKPGQPFSSEFRIKHKTEGYVWFMISGQVKWDVFGKPASLAGTLMNINEVKQARAQLELYNKRLQKANKDLDHFAYSASHDLRTPLRGIHNIAQWIEEDLGDDISDETQDLLSLLRGRVERLDGMLHDILAFSRIGQDVLSSEAVDLNEIVSEVISWMSPLEGSQINVEGSLPTVWGCRTSLEQIFLNVLVNARKHHDLEHANISITCIDLPESHCISISDDGPGIPEEYHDQVFELFKTLKRKDEVEGSGLGMPIIKKAVESMGGEIKIESTTGKRGTTISFTLPRQDQNLLPDHTQLTA